MSQWMASRENALPQLALVSGAALINTQRGETGAVTRSVQAKLRDQISVLDFGAVGDGATDDTTAIQNAHAAWKLSKTSGPLFFPGGATYQVSSLTLTGDVNWEGGAGAVIRCSNAGPAVQENFITVSGHTSIYLKGLGFDGNALVDRLVSATNAADVGAGRTVTAVDCAFENANTATQFSAGLAVFGGHDRVFALNSVFRNIDASGTSKSSQGLYVGVSGAYYVRHVVAHGCEFDDITPVNDGDGIFYTALTGAMNDSHLDVSACKFRNCAKRSVKCQAYSARIVGNHIQRTLDHGGGTEIAIQAGGGEVASNTFYYPVGAYAPDSALIQINNVLDAATPTSHLNPSRVEDNVVYVGDDTPIDHFIQVNCALASTGNDFVSIVGNKVHGHLIKFANLLPNDGDTAHVQLDELLIERNYVRALSGTNHAFIWGGRLDGTEAPDLGSNVEIRARVRDNVVGNAAPAYRNNTAGTAFTTGSGVDFTVLEWTNNHNLPVPFIDATTPADVTTRSGAGAVGLDHRRVHLASTGVNAWTLADGDEGQELLLVVKSWANTSTLTPTNFAGGTSMSFGAAGETASLLFTNGAWHFMGGTCTVNP